MQQKPQMTIVSDYDGFFEKLVDSWIARKIAAGGHIIHSSVRVTAGPYRSSAVTYRSDGKEIHFDFYSALRVGFGSLTEVEIEELIALI